MHAVRKKQPALRPLGPATVGGSRQAPQGVRGATQIRNRELRRAVDVELLRRALRYRSLGRYGENAPESSGEHRLHGPAELGSKLRCFVAGRLPHQIDERFTSATADLCRGYDEMDSEPLR